MGTNGLGCGRITHSVACARARAARQSPGDRPWLPCARGSRDAACAPACLVGRSASPVCLRWSRRAAVAKRAIAKWPVRKSPALSAPALKWPIVTASQFCGAAPGSLRWQSRLPPAREVSRLIGDGRQPSQMPRSALHVPTPLLLRGFLGPFTFRISRRQMTVRCPPGWTSACYLLHVWFWRLAAACGRGGVCRREIDDHVG